MTVKLSSSFNRQRGGGQQAWCCCCCCCCCVCCKAASWALTLCHCLRLVLGDSEEAGAELMCFFFFFCFLGGRPILYTFMYMQRKNPQASDGTSSITKAARYPHNPHNPHNPLHSEQLQIYLNRLSPVNLVACCTQILLMHYPRRPQMLLLPVEKLWPLSQLHLVIRLRSLWALHIRWVRLYLGNAGMLMLDVIPLTPSWPLHQTFFFRRQAQQGAIRPITMPCW